MREATIALTRSLDREIVLATLLGHLRRLVHFDRASVMLLEEEARVSVRAVLDGDHIAHGFRNRDIRSTLFGEDSQSPTRRSAATGRLLKRLHVRQLVAKIPRTRRWRVTERGRHLLASAITLYQQTWPALAAA